MNWMTALMIVATMTGVRMNAGLMQQALQSRVRSTSIAFTELEPDLEISRTAVAAGGQSVGFTLVRTSLNRFQIRVAVPPGTENGDTLTGFREHYKAVAVLSGGFLTSFYPPIPLGMIKTGGRLVNRPAAGDLLTGLFAVRRGKPAIIPLKGFDEQNWEDCLQSGPLLIMMGRPSLPDQSTALVAATRALVFKAYPRAFVGITTDSRVVLGVTDAITLPDLVDVLVRSAKDGGLQLDAALNLGGAGSAGLLVTVNGREIVAGNRYPSLANSLLIVRGGGR